MSFSLGLAYFLSGIFFTGALAGLYFAKVSRSPDAARVMKILALAAGASSVICFGYPAMAGVLVLFWLAHGLARVSPFKNSVGAVILAVCLVIGCLSLIATPMIPTWLVVPLWVVVSTWSGFVIVGALGWIVSAFKGMRW